MSVTLGTPLQSSAFKVLLLGSGELGKEVVISLQRLGVEVHAADRYDHAPAMQVAHYSYTLNMADPTELKQLIEKIKPNLIVPEIEAIATEVLLEIEQRKTATVIPSAKAVNLTMNREGIRRLAAETLKLPTSPYFFAETETEYQQAVEKIGFPCVIKPVMSSSGKGQSVVRQAEQVSAAWQYAQEGGRAGRGRVIVEGFVPFDYEITLLTVSAVDGIHFCAPIGHRQEDGDYRESWQPQMMSDELLAKSQHVAREVVKALGGYGLFGVELFIKGDEVYFSEVSPRPHDTGMVTLISQDLSEFALHVRAILGLPIGKITQYGPAASAVILREGDSTDIGYGNLSSALALIPGAQLRLFGKPEIAGRRRLGVALVRADNVELAIEQAKQVAAAVDVKF